MGSSSKHDGTSLANLLHELSDFLQAQNEESTTTTPHSSSAAVALRIRTVLLALSHECLDFRIGQDQHSSQTPGDLTVADSACNCRQRARACSHAQACHGCCAEIPLHGLRRQVLSSTFHAATDHSHVSSGEIQARVCQPCFSGCTPIYLRAIMPLYRNVHSALLGLVFSLVTLLPEGSVPVHSIVCRGVAELVEGNWS